jgi:hypothetical protein
MILALLQFVSTLIVVVAYDMYSHRKLDGIREDLRVKVEKELHG